MRSADAKAYEAWSKAIDERNAANAEIEKRKSEYDSLRRDYASLRRDYDTRGDLLAKAREEANALRPDAEAMRAKRKRDREQKAAKQGVEAQPCLPVPPSRRARRLPVGQHGRSPAVMPHGCAAGRALLRSAAGVRAEKGSE